MPLQDVRIVLTVDGEPVPVDAPVPAGRVRVDELLPAMHAVADALIARGVQRAEAGGRRISCSKGCSSCCRAQPVPIAPVEAQALARLVRQMPSPRREEVRARFAERVDTLKAAGLYELFSRAVPVTGRDQARDAARRYMELGLDCPFLSDDACSIHPQRPLVCRRYLVTSPVSWCAAPLTHPVEVVPVPGRPTGALLTACEAVTGRPQLTVPLVLALDQTVAHGDENGHSVDAQGFLRDWIAALS